MNDSCRPRMRETSAGPVTDERTTSEALPDWIMSRTFLLLGLGLQDGGSTCGHPR